MYKTGMKWIKLEHYQLGCNWHSTGIDPQSNLIFQRFINGPVQWTVHILHTCPLAHLDFQFSLVILIELILNLYENIKLWSKNLILGKNSNCEFEFLCPKSLKYRDYDTFIYVLIWIFTPKIAKLEVCRFCRSLLLVLLRSWWRKGLWEQ